MYSDVGRRSMISFILVVNLAYFILYCRHVGEIELLHAAALPSAISCDNIVAIKIVSAMVLLTGLSDENAKTRRGFGRSPKL